MAVLLKRKLADDAMRWGRLAALLFVLVTLVALLPPDEIPPSWDKFFVGLIILGIGMYARSAWGWMLCVLRPLVRRLGQRR
jgi:hypothetical protein